MSELTELTSQLAGFKTRFYNRLVAQGDQTIQANDNMDTYLTHIESLRKINNKNITVTANGVYNVDTANGYSGNGIVTVNVSGSSTNNRLFNINDRVFPDNEENSIGTVSSFFVDGNGIEYAVVCLDSTYRLASAQWENPNSWEAITNLPQYGNRFTAAFGNGSETATFNNQKILDWEATYTSYTHPAVSHCRSKSFVINGVTYYGQLPNICELSSIWFNAYKLSLLDPTESSAANDVKLQQMRSVNSWSSSQYDNSSDWCLNSYGGSGSMLKDEKCFVCPVLEIPNVVA